MPELDLPLVEPTAIEACELVLPETYDLSFEGFRPEAFAVLDRLRARPHIEQYREDKDALRRFLQEPFKRYRDDLVVNCVLPNRLRFETERNVFSRLLKNDFGAGGCHHHLWMAFYRPGRKRLTDLQLSHSISPDGFVCGLYVGDYATDLLRQSKQRIAAQPGRFLELLNPLLEDPRWRLAYDDGSGKRDRRIVHEAPLRDVPEALQKANGIWVRAFFNRGEVLQWKGELVPQALEAMCAVWPLYRFYGAGHGVEH